MVRETLCNCKSFHRSYHLLTLLFYLMYSRLCSNFFCYNNGICRHGHGKFGSYTGQEPTLDDLPFEKEFHDNGMYCTCPVGYVSFIDIVFLHAQLTFSYLSFLVTPHKFHSYTGLQCEIKYVVCGRDDHTCFNGSACVKGKIEEKKIDR